MADYTYNLAWNGTGWVPLVQPSVFKMITTQANGNTALWTPTTGMRFRILRCMILITANASMSGGGVLDVVLRDGPTTVLAVGYSMFVPSTAGSAFGGGASTGWLDLGLGILSSAVNNVLNVNLSSALTGTGKVRVMVAGSEE